MKLIFISFLLLVAIQFESLSQCAGSGNIYAFTYNGKNYEVVRENKTWVDAAACAVERGGYLAEVNDSAENMALFNELTANAGINVSNTVAPDGGGASYVWIGGNDLSTEGVWIWDGNNDSSGPQFWQGTSTGNPVGGLYNNWGNEPDNWNGQDGLGLAITNWPLGVASEWNDVDETNTLYFVIEYDSTGGLNENGHSFLISPNPSGNQVSIEGRDLQKISLITTSGEKVLEISDPDPERNDISLAAVAQGVFLLRLELTNGTVIIERLVKT